MTKPVFTEGSILRHIINMAVTGAIGLTALFFVDFLNMFFLSMLGQQELAAAVGFAGSILFFTIAICIGLSISCGALVGKALGASSPIEAKRFLVNNLVVAIILSSIIALIIFISIEPLLLLLGASGKTFSFAVSYLKIIIPSMPILAAGMVLGAGIRAVGDPKLAMYVVLAGGLVNAIFDPILIFGAGLDIKGAAISSILARLTMLLCGVYGVFIKHKLYRRFTMANFKSHFQPIAQIAMPAIITNIATPFANAVIMAVLAGYGDNYIAGYAVIGRLMPVAFSLVFALSGAVGPIIAQNYGAGQFDRVKLVLSKSIIFSTIYTLAICIILMLAQGVIIALFKASGEAKTIIAIFCNGFSLFFIFNGTLFIANALFNNIGHPRFATMFNLGKATLGTIPFVYAGSYYGGVWGIWIGISLGGMFFGISSLYMAFKLVAKAEVLAQPDSLILATTVNPLSSSCTQLGQVVEEIDGEGLS